MEYEVVMLEEKRVVGFCQRTGNDKEDIGNVIGGLWKKLTQVNDIQGRKNKKYIGLYTDYIGMEYDTTIGCEVNKNAPIPKDMTEKIIPAGKYAKFVLHGDVVKTVQKAWGNIWKMNLERTFTGDFEEYQEGEDMQNMEIHIYVAIK
ncbi:GyrI-like domain-containing protein [Clostridium sp. MD294]|uniref:GyrI-like domain-containing protein n=1 Tax=Clostridium sp. MD294 TaxID=97138 RepID=UPI0002C9DA87|nr:GyrI-like domain-containing protein [Clostridium sp. MD294]NDO47433.1 AraC family transcriptional regulator [Clostridium sp. MD294]USF29496.1 hypothetical protein C820_000887 [Clostridium sp. MD294]